MCPNTQNATPVIDRQTGTIYVLASDGRLRALDIVNGEDRFPPTPFVTPFSRNWSLNLIDGVLYTYFGRGCGGAVASFAAMDVSKPDRPVTTFVVSAGRPGGAWGRAGLVLGPRGLYTQTADGPNDVATNKYGNSVLVLEPKTLKVVDYFTPWGTEFLNSKDLDLGSGSPITFSYKNWELVAAAAKESTIYLLDGKNLGGPNHDTPLFQQRYANDYFELAGHGVWGAMSTWADPQGERWLYVPIWGPPSRTAPKFKYAYGMSDTGSVMGFQLGVDKDKPTLIPVWMSRALAVPDPPVVANGVVFALSTGENTRQGITMPIAERTGQVTNAILYAFDAATGKELWSSGNQIDSWAHFSGLAVAGGRVYVVTRHSRVYSFGLKK
jgi:outer membrane protein assembly factor BamB